MLLTVRIVRCPLELVMSRPVKVVGRMVGARALQSSLFESRLELQRKS